MIRTEIRHTFVGDIILVEVEEVLTGLVVPTVGGTREPDLSIFLLGLIRDGVESDDIRIESICTTCDG